MWLRTGSLTAFDRPFTRPPRHFRFRVIYGGILTPTPSRRWLKPPHERRLTSLGGGLSAAVVCTSETQFEVLADPDDCRRFYRCVNGIARHWKCWDGRFDEAEVACKPASEKWEATPGSHRRGQPMSPSGLTRSRPGGHICAPSFFAGGVITAACSAVKFSTTVH